MHRYPALVSGSGNGDASIAISLNAAAKRGAGIYDANCASCHSGDETDQRLYPAEEVGTDPLREPGALLVRLIRVNAEPSCKDGC